MFRKRFAQRYYLALQQAVTETTVTAVSGVCQDPKAIGELTTEQWCMLMQQLYKNPVYSDAMQL